MTKRAIGPEPALGTGGPEITRTCLVLHFSFNAVDIAVPHITDVDEKIDTKLNTAFI